MQSIAREENIMVQTETEDAERVETLLRRMSPEEKE